MTYWPGEQLRALKKAGDTNPNAAPPVEPTPGMAVVTPKPGPYPQPEPSQPGALKDETAPQTKEQQYGNIKPTLGTLPLLRPYGVLRPAVFDITAELEWKFN